MTIVTARQRLGYGESMTYEGGFRQEAKTNHEVALRNAAKAAERHISADHALGIAKGDLDPKLL